jgi:hypothetical protein
MIKKMQRENITSVTIKDKAADDFQEHQEMYVKRTAWIGPCSSWFRRTHDGEFSHNLIAGLLTLLF